MLIPDGGRSSAAVQGVTSPAADSRIRPVGRGRTGRGSGAHGCGLRVLSTVLALGLASAGCGRGRSDANSSTRVSLGVASSRGQVSVHSKSAVIEAYRGFFPGVGRALQAPSDRVRGILTDLASGSYLDFEIRQVVDHQARELEPWGQPVIHITAVELRPVTATVHDCQDASHAGLADRRTHLLVPQSRGNAHRNLIAYLTLGGDQRWRLTDLVQHRAACHRS